VKSRDEIAEEILAKVKSDMESKGVGSVKVDDGRIFMFTKTFLVGMIEKMELDGNEHLMVFISSDEAKPVSN
jgi:hypothetical protein